MRSDPSSQLIVTQAFYLSAELVTNLSHAVNAIEAFQLNAIRHLVPPGECVSPEEGNLS